MEAQTHTADNRHIPEVQELRNTIGTMGSLSQEGFSEIAAIASLALARLETPEAYRFADMDNIATALQAIWGKARMIENYINAEAEGVGCNHVNERRWDARAVLV